MGAESNTLTKSYCKSTYVLASEMNFKCMQLCLVNTLGSFWILCKPSVSCAVMSVIYPFVLLFCFRNMLGIHSRALRLASKH